MVEEGSPTVRRRRLAAELRQLREAKGRSGELGWLRRRESSGQERQLQNIVSLSALESLLAGLGVPLSERKRRLIACACCA